MTLVDSELTGDQAEGPLLEPLGRGTLYHGIERFIRTVSSTSTPVLAHRMADDVNQHCTFGYCWGVFRDTASETGNVLL
jgi:hypothetical protein